MVKTKVLSVVNQKGGIVKSTTVYNLGAGLAMSGKKFCCWTWTPNAERKEMPRE